MLLTVGEGQGPLGVPTECGNCGHDDPVHAYRPCVPGTGEPCDCRTFRPIEGWWQNRPNHLGE
jgi:hypothetical protein